MSNNASNAAAGGSRIIMIGAHTDSPCLRLRPRSPIKPKEGIIQLGVSTYGGGLWHTWFDRGLGMAGKVVIHNNKGCIEERLIRVDRPVAIIPNLAIHLQTAEERNAGFKINPEEHLMPIFCSSKYYHHQQQQAAAGGHDDKQNTDDDAMVNGNHRALMELLSKEAGCSINDIIDFDVCMMDATPSSMIGVYDEFISSPRIDNLLSTWACMEALSSQSDHLIDGKDIYIAAAFDHEECGSTSYTGANSMTLQSWIKRILSSLDQQSHAHRYFSQIIARSILVSADGAHAIHPNYPSKHQSEHKVYLHDGIVIKTNTNQRYATNALTASMIRALASSSSNDTRTPCGGSDAGDGVNTAAPIPIQDFVVRNDSPCGSTIGPMMSANIGIRTIDLGAAQWAMHSCRETCSVDDAAHLVSLCEVIYKHWGDIDDNLIEVMDDDDEDVRQ
ncbi:hypothetical protein FOZ61_008091 [Perkinsus olseni]|uniref:aspartyl aminopeptidase n=2 Tax=Perkinsus olseni TaxID=32597 RepID=A0A7J6L693_PEROL|nr:hypothetical protein FOZ61_008091 [Perkinsus olseni]